MLPAYPFMVYLTVMVCSRHKDSKLVAAGIAIPAAILGIAALAEPFISDTEWVAALGFDIDKMTPIRYACYALMSGSFMTLWYLYKRRNINWAIKTLSLTVLTLVFIAGFAIRDFNPDLGYKALAETAIQLKRQHPEAEIITYKIDRPENIDVYLRNIPFRIYEEDAIHSTEKIGNATSPVIVMTQIRYTDEIPNIKEYHPVGTQYAILLTTPSTSL